MDLTLSLQNDMNSGLLWCGLSGKQLGSLPQNESMDLHLTMITTIPGLQVSSTYQSVFSSGRAIALPPVSTSAS